MDTQQLADLTRRLERLERQNRRLRLILLAVPLAAVALLGLAAAPAPRDETVTAKAFKVTDENGNVRAELAGGKDGSQLILYDENGKPRFKVRADVEGTGPALSLLDVSGRPWISMAGHDMFDGKAKQLEPYFLIKDRDGKVFGEMRKRK